MSDTLSFFFLLADLKLKPEVKVSRRVVEGEGACVFGVPNVLRDSRFDFYVWVMDKIIIKTKQKQRNT